ncbi:hypothetical protein FRC14_007469 [Serendipita sp. 396]|nr:hypothetical protein FRC14_007469 [Serendipita sp. 396]KAG8786547.1 hypothetical protein FRC15_011193 [Serendipita sp. 397]KAG8803567.1 hypothetical protein FRC16_004440 [Serendipita sp. 398]KAG8827502.1 hypothetical protein FRC19_002580 [Serendipita sp. 401]KAG8839418.1 hypothetical protein FRC18_010898 [Serendipita sp. 400]KAG8853725.1 hypothetical protein FRB91_004427 [Serendipita sp. 411]KAG8871212.1 hypothetical protein FRC20_010827 [Serendipita sp. 405]KAG9057909.1 hypothetical prot
MSNTVQKSFIQCAKFAVLGASTNREKYGNKVLRWYQKHELPVTPINAKEDMIEGLRTVASLGDLDSLQTTGVSIITPPQVTIGALSKVLELNIPAVWIQPGAADDAVAEYIRENNLVDKVVYGGPCILVLGEQLLANRQEESRL